MKIFTKFPVLGKAPLGGGWQSQAANLHLEPPQNFAEVPKKDQAFAMWQGCKTQEEIAEAVEVTQPTVLSWEEGFIKNSEAEDFINSRDFDPPFYNVWKQQTKSNSVSHFGNSEPRWVENLLYLYQTR